MFGYSFGDILFVVLIICLVQGIMWWLAKRKKARTDAETQQTASRE